MIYGEIIWSRFVNVKFAFILRSNTLGRNWKSVESSASVQCNETAVSSWDFSCIQLLQLISLFSEHVQLWESAKTLRGICSLLQDVGLFNCVWLCGPIGGCYFFSLLYSPWGRWNKRLIGNSRARGCPVSCGGAGWRVLLPWFFLQTSTSFPCTSHPVLWSCSQRGCLIHNIQSWWVAATFFHWAHLFNFKVEMREHSQIDKTF